MKVLKMKQDSDEAFMIAETLLGSSGLDQEKIVKVKEIINEAKLKIYQNDESDRPVYKEPELINMVENPNILIPELRCVLPPHYKTCAFVQRLTAYRVSQKNAH